MMPILVDDAIAEYQMDKGQLRPATQAQIFGELARWRAWLVDRTSPQVQLGEVDHKVMAVYFNGLVGRLRDGTLEPSTFNHYRKVHLTFWKFCAGEGWVDLDAMRKVRSVTVSEKERLLLSGTELLEMLNSATNPRDRFALALGMNTGLRASDIRDLNVGSFNLIDNRIHLVVSKTQRRLELPISKGLRRETLRWFEYYANWFELTVQELPNDWSAVPPMRGLTLPGFGQSVTIRSTERFVRPQVIVHESLKRFGYVTKGEGFHTLRRSAGRHAYDQAAAQGREGPIRVAMVFLGHKNQAMTEHYIGVTQETQQLDDMLRGQDFIEAAAAREAAVNARLDNGIARKVASA